MLAGKIIRKNDDISQIRGHSCGGPKFLSQDTNMKKIVLTFGLISGVVCSVMMAATVPFGEQIGFEKAEYLGYTIIVLSFLMVFFGIRSYRENVLNGQITFARGFLVGILITLVTCIFYVATWEVMYYNFMPDFMDKYSAHILEKAKSSGMSAEALRSKIQELQKAKELYANPFYNAALTFLEPFPVGLAMTPVSALILRKRLPSQPARAAVVASLT